MHDKKPNRLIHEKSPYLLQHAYNPVDWYPWGTEAFERARSEQKPIFLSIGYSTCHWCHVMERESFEDEEVAALLNDAFVCVKVDREERPDLDALYMTAAQIMIGGGGWPLNLCITPERKPFFAATYIPKTSALGRKGLFEIIPVIKDLWKTRKNDIVTSAETVTKQMQSLVSYPAGHDSGAELLDKAFSDLTASFDPENGGFGAAPKFPTPHLLTFLLRYHRRTGKEEALEMAVKTLLAMRSKGIYDHIGFGFHRYATDEHWIVPHFEKMLYDQALLMTAYAEAYQVTRNPLFRRTVEEIFTYVTRDLLSPEGGFYAGEDADSEGKEGLFYVWSLDEVRRALTPEEAEHAVSAFHLLPDGNYHDEATGEATGKNILFRKTILADNSPMLERIIAALFTVRSRRTRPHRDEKILTDWNSLMIAALAKSASVTGNRRYLDAAEKAMRFILSAMRDGQGRLLHSYREGKASVPAFLEDYAFLIHALLELYAAAQKNEYLSQAFEFQKVLTEHFWDTDAGGFFQTPDYQQDILVRKKDIYDGAMPSGNSISLLNLLRLGRMSGEQSFLNDARRMLKCFLGAVAEAPMGYSRFLSAFSFALGPGYDVVIAGHKDSADMQALVSVIREVFAPTAVTIFFDPAQNDTPQALSWIREYGMRDGKATAYVCVDQACQLPATDPEEMRKFLLS